MDEQQWKLMPVEPTEEMLEKTFLLTPKSDYEHDAYGYYEELWGAFLAASPEPPEAFAQARLESYNEAVEACAQWMEDSPTMSSHADLLRRALKRASP